MIAAIIYAVFGSLGLVWAWRNRDTLRWFGRVINAIRDKDEHGNPIETKHPIRDWWQRRKRK